MELFEFRPINFLIKPLEYSKIERVIDKYFSITLQNNRLYEIAVSKLLCLCLFGIFRAVGIISSIADFNFLEINTEEGICCNQHIRE